MKAPNTFTITLIPLHYATKEQHKMFQKKHLQGSINDDKKFIDLSAQLFKEIFYGIPTEFPKSKKDWH